MIQDPRAGITVYLGLPPPPWEDGGQRRGRWSWFRSSHETCLLPGDYPRPTPGYGAEAFVHMLILFAHGNITPVSGCCFLTTMEFDVVVSEQFLVWF